MNTNQPGAAALAWWRSQAPKRQLVWVLAAAFLAACLIGLPGAITRAFEHPCDRAERLDREYESDAAKTGWRNAMSLDEMTNRLDEVTEAYEACNAKLDG